MLQFLSKVLNSTRYFFRKPVQDKGVAFQLNRRDRSVFCINPGQFLEETLTLPRHPLLINFRRNVLHPQRRQHFGNVVR